MADDTDETQKDNSNDEFVRVAKLRFKRCEDWESTARDRWLDDWKFFNADAYNMYQWPDSARQSRGFGTNDERPCLTVNKTRQHCLQVINDARQNKTSVKIKAVGDRATFEAAQVYEGIIRHIEYASNAQAHYTTATKFQVAAGIGYLCVLTDYVDDLTFDQEIRFSSIADPQTVYMDPDSVEPDGSDQRFCFVFNDVPRDEFDLRYPQYKDEMAPRAPLGNEDGWIAEKHVRVAQYWHREEVPDTLVIFTNPDNGEQSPIKMSETKGWKSALKKALKEQLDDPFTKTRRIIRHQVKIATIIGDKLEGEKDWAGETIPIVPVIGEQTSIDGELDRKGHVRALIDSQRMLNYNASAAIEYGALQGKQPWLAAAAAIEGMQTAWETANLQNLSVLTWNHMDDDGQPIPAPVRPQPPMGSPLYQEGMQNAANDMMAVSGQYQPMLGEPSNERSGKAIQARQRQGENATYHFIDHQARAICRLGKIALELIPHIYDTPRVIKILGEDGSDSDVSIDPDAAKAYETRKAETEQTAEQVIFNPSVGRYEVISDVGPDFATRRQEAFNALSQIAQQNPELMSVIGDLVMLAADFPLADEAAERLRRMVPPQALGEGPPPGLQQAQQAMQAYQALNASMSQKLIELQQKLQSKDAQKSIDIYEAITKRIDVLQKSGLSPKDHLTFLHELAIQEHGATLDAASRVLDSALSADVAEGAPESAA